ncbi:bifunctional riboflavin kinase/FAD synthetase [Thiofilum flexile]|uniref:bifunctional riboflavin kinase/FAD synthetase n=1 Tax=Thiofilum flexile TaxID=125627 RepID=UPI000381CE66|nr:bifunctional riboflavin kinase/FAD synthetase [Thiofilum flexile]
MRLVRHLTDFNVASPSAATIGNFDGVHLGHQQVIQHVIQQAKQRGLVSTVISFEPLPAEYFRKPPPNRIYPLRDKVRCLRREQFEYFVCLRFNEALATMPAEAFVEQILINQLQVQYLVVGDDFRFGAGRKGDYQLLQDMGQHHGMQVLDTPTVLTGTQRISSSLIREYLAQAQLTAANTLLGRPYQLSGRVSGGRRLGRTLGFPTLNLTMPDNLALRRGVYVVKVHGLGTKPYYGVANLGQRPTVGGENLRFEVHVFDFDQTVYGQLIQVEPLYFLRDEQKFASLDALKAQIQQDSHQARHLLQEQSH